MLEEEAFLMQRIELLIILSIFWIFLLGPAFGADQNLAAGAPQNAEDKIQPETATKGEGNQNVGVKNEVEREQTTTSSVTEASGPVDAQANDSEKGKGGEKALEEKAPLEKRPLDRRWFMKNTTEKGNKMPQKKPAPVKWKDKPQETRCKGYGEELRAKHSKTQHYSVQGDACRTAENAEAFLNLFEIFTRECPNEFVLQSGYSPTVKENVILLKELGTKECLRGGGGKPR